MSLIEGLTPDQFIDLQGVLKYEESYRTRMMIQQKSGYMPPRWKPLINKKGFFYSGLLADCIKHLKNKGIEYELILPKMPELSEQDIEDGIFRLNNMPVKPRPYQLDAILTMVESRRGVTVAGTGAGKSIIIGGLCHFLYKKTLVVVDSVDIAEQLAKEIAFYTGEPVGLIKGGRWETNHMFTVAVSDSIHSKTKGKMKKEVKDFIKSIKVFIIDECHHATAPSYELMIELIDAPYRFGLTATPLGNYYQGEQGLTSNAPLLKGLLGSTVFSKSTNDLIAEGWLSIPHIHLLEHKMSFNKDEDEIGEYQDEETKWICEDIERNQKAVNVITQAVSENKNCIVFVNRVEHGKLFAKLLEQNGIDPSLLRFAYGEIIGPQRQQMFSEFRSGEAKVLIGTVLNEGLNFQIDVGLNLGGGMTPRLAVQRLGRILRKPRSASGDVDTATPCHTIYYDFLDKVHPIFRRHSNERKSVYENDGHKITEVKEPKKQKKATFSTKDF
jgi:superfamily II DNA or RNA helicase